LGVSLSLPRSAGPQTLLQICLAQLFKVAATNKLNLFFGVAPRVGDGGRFDQAWQIRVVRALWADIDHVSVEEALKRCADAGLPPPSIVIRSGSGVHLYWLLHDAYFIDDVGEPPEVFSEWVDGEGENKRPRKYILERGSDERLYLNVRANIPGAEH
jgi:hypothetical protein